MENKIPTSEEFIRNFDREVGHTFEQDVPKAMIEFAKLHVEAALNAACTSDGYEIDEESVLNAYPLTNIK